MLLHFNNQNPKVKLWGQKFNFGVILLLCLTLAISPLQNTRVKADTVSDLQQRIGEKNDAIKRLEEEIKAYEQSLNQTTDKAKTLQNELAALNLSKKKLETELKKTQANLDKTTILITQITGDIAITENEISDKRALIGKTLRGIREEEDNTLLENILASTSIGEISDFVENSEKLNEAIRSNIDRLRESENLLEKQKTDQEGKKAELKKLQSNLSGQKKAVLDTTTDRKSVV